MGTLKDESTGTCLAALDILNGYILDIREEGVVEPLASIHAGDVKKVLHLVKYTVFEGNVSDETATVGIGLDIQATLAVTSVVTILHIDILNTCGHLTA